MRESDLDEMVEDQAQGNFYCCSLSPHPTSHNNNSTTTTTMPTIRRDSVGRPRRRTLVVALSCFLLLHSLLPCPSEGSSSSSIATNLLLQRKATATPSCFLFSSSSGCFSPRAAGMQGVDKRRSSYLLLTAR